MDREVRRLRALSRSIDFARWRSRADPSGRYDADRAIERISPGLLRSFEDERRATGRNSPRGRQRGTESLHFSPLLLSLSHSFLLFLGRGNKEVDPLLKKTRSRQYLGVRPRRVPEKTPKRFRDPRRRCRGVTRPPPALSREMLPPNREGSRNYPRRIYIASDI